MSQQSEPKPGECWHLRERAHRPDRHATVTDAAWTPDGRKRVVWFRWHGDKEETNTDVKLFVRWMERCQEHNGATP